MYRRPSERTFLFIHPVEANSGIFSGFCFLRQTNRRTKRHPERMPRTGRPRPAVPKER